MPGKYTVTLLDRLLQCPDEYYYMPSWVSGLCVGIYNDELVYYKNGRRTHMPAGHLASTPIGAFRLYTGEHMQNALNKDDINKELNMNNVNYVGGDYKIVAVIYELKDINLGVEPYYFKADIDLEVRVDDLVVVESSRGYGLTKVVSVYEDNMANKDKSKQATAWVVDKVDLTKHLQKKETTERLEYIKNKLDERSKQVEAIKVYELLASVDPEAKLLIDEMKSLLSLNAPKTKE